MLTFELFLESNKEKQIAYLKRKRGELTKPEEELLATVAKIPAKMTVSGWKVDVTKHAQARSVQRRFDKTGAEWKELIRKATRWLEANKKKRGVYMFHSTDENQSFVGAVDGSHIDVITIYPRGTNGRIGKDQESKGCQPAIYESANDELKEMLTEAEQLGYTVDEIIFI